MVVEVFYTCMISQYLYDYILRPLHRCWKYPPIKKNTFKWAVYGCLIPLGIITYILAMQRFRVVYHGVTHELLVSSRYTHESFQRNAIDKEIRLVAKSNVTYACRTMGRLGVLPSSV